MRRSGNRGVERPVHPPGRRVALQMRAVCLRFAAGDIAEGQSGAIVQAEVELFGVVEVLHPFDQDVDLVYGLEQVDVEAQRVALWIGVWMRLKKSGSAPVSGKVIAASRMLSADTEEPCPTLASVTIPYSPLEM